MANNTEKKSAEAGADKEKRICFVIMPFSDPDGYEQGHFKKVYEQIFRPAIQDAGFEPFRMDDSSKSTLIHADMFDHLIHDPIALCDLSAKNPNVLYELGVRHAFDLPVVLVQEEGQSKIFDINGVNTQTYRRSRRYDEVIDDRKKITDAIRETVDAEKKYSFMNLVKMQSAPIKNDGNISDYDRLEVMIRNLTRVVMESEKKRNARSEISHVGDYARDYVTFALNKATDMAMELLRDSVVDGKHIPVKELRSTYSELSDAIQNYEEVMGKAGPEWRRATDAMNMFDSKFGMKI